MKEWIKEKWKNVLSISMLVLVVIPLEINYLFKKDFGIELLRAEWDASDALSFYGMLLAAIGTVYGVHLSINHSNKVHKDNLQNQVRPFFATYNLKTKSKQTWLYPTENLKLAAKEMNIEEGYREYKLTDYWYVLRNGIIECKDGLSDEQKELLDQGGFKWLKSGGVSMCVASDHICHPMEIENVGNGAALSFRIGFNRKKTSQKERQYAYTIPVKVGEKIMVHIFSEDCGEESANLGDYVLDLHYKDIYGNEYYQQHDIKLYYSSERNCPMSAIQFDEKQVLVKRADCCESMGDKSDGSSQARKDKDTAS